MTVAELMYGRGTPTPLSELLYEWPAFWAWEVREADRQRELQENQKPRTLG